MKVLLKAENVRKVYSTRFNRTTALNGVNFTVEEGEFVGIMGPSGSGKSTLLNVISTIDTPTQGHIFYDKQDITKLGRHQLENFRRDQLGFIFQDFNLLDTLTVKENIILPLTVRKIPIKEMEERVETVATVLDISEILNKYPYEISGGQKQRTAAARAIVGQPRILLADEPTGSLDSKSATELLELMSGINAKHGTTMLVVTHDPYVASFCKRILFIKDGNIYGELYSDGNKKHFYNKIMDMLVSMGGGQSDVL